MALSDLVLKARVNMALIRDPRVGVFDIGVFADNGHVTLTGDTDSPDECSAAEEIVRRVPGVVSVKNEMTCGVGQKADTAELVTQRFLEKLSATWQNLPDHTALTQADYLRWALWMVYKFHLPKDENNTETARLESEAIELALEQIARNVGASKALIALAMLQQAEQITMMPGPDAPKIENRDLIATPIS